GVEAGGAASGGAANEPLALQLDQPFVNLPAPGRTPCEGNQPRHGPLAVENQDDFARLDMLEVPRQVVLQFGDASLPHVAIIAMFARAGQSGPPSRAHRGAGRTSVRVIRPMFSRHIHVVPPCPGPNLFCSFLFATPRRPRIRAARAKTLAHLESRRTLPTSRHVSPLG